MSISEQSQAAQSLFAAAQQGDQQALDQFLTHLRPQILMTCYRIIGRVEDAEDAAQEAMISILEGLGSAALLPSWQPLVFGSSARASLLVIADQDEITGADENERSGTDSSRRARHAEPLLTGQIPLPEIDALEHFAGRGISTRESLALVFVNVLQILPPLARAAYVLADLLGCEEAAITHATQLTPPQVVEHLVFARRIIETARTKLPTEAMPPSNPIAAKILHRLGKAMIAQQAQRAVSVFDLDAVVVIPGMGSFTGHEAIAVQFSRMFIVGLAPQKTAMIEINGQPALVCFQQKEDRGKMRYFANLIMAATISERPPNANKILRVDVVTDSKMLHKVGKAARQVKKV